MRWQKNGNAEPLACLQQKTKMFGVGEAHRCLVCRRQSRTTVLQFGSPNKKSGCAVVAIIQRIPNHQISSRS
jgi:hypothetical protein